MTPHKLAIDEMSDHIKQEGQRSFERWKANYLHYKQADNTIEAVKAIEIWADSQTWARRGFYRRHRCKEPDEVLTIPHWNPSLGHNYYSYVEKTDPNGNEYSLEEINKAEFVCINLALDFLDDEYKLLMGVPHGKSGSDDQTEKTKTNPWAENNSQTVLIFYYGLLSMGYEPRKTDHVAAFARFLHLLTGKEFKSLGLSDFYDKLKVAPIVNKNDYKLLKELQTVRGHFETIGYREPLVELDIEIARTNVKIENSKKKTKQAK